MKSFLVIVAVAVLAGLTGEFIRWRLAGEHSSWVILKDPSAPRVAVGTDAQGLRSLIEASPSPTWKHAGAVRSSTTPPVTSLTYEAAVRTGHIVELPNKTRAKVIDRAELTAQGLRPPTTSSGAGLRREGVVEVIEIEVREGPHKGLIAWLLPDLMQHEVAWP
jgi:hypothetical protein